MELLACAFATCSGDESSLTLDQDGLYTVSATLIAESSRAFAVALETVVAAYGGEVPSGLTSATSTLPTNVGVMDELLTAGPVFGCSSPQMANTLDTWTCGATSIGELCAVECAFHGTPEIVLGI